MLEREGDVVPSSDATKHLPPQVQDVNGYLGRMEDVYDRLLVAHSSMVIIQCASEYGDPMTLQEIPFAIGMMEKEIEKVMDDLDDLSRIGGACIKAGGGMDDVLLKFGPM